MCTCRGTHALWFSVYLGFFSWIKNYLQSQIVYSSGALKQLAIHLTASLMAFATKAWRIAVCFLRATWGKVDTAGVCRAALSWNNGDVLPEKTLAMPVTTLPGLPLVQKHEFCTENRDTRIWGVSMSHHSGPYLVKRLTWAQKLRNTTAI